MSEKSGPGNIPERESLGSCAAVIAAGGEGRRMGGPVKKQFLEIGGRSMLRHCLDLFLAIPEIRRIVVVLPAEEVSGFRRSLGGDEEGKVAVVAGGSTRQESVYKGLLALEGSGVEVVAIHDAARPLADPAVIRETLRIAGTGCGAVACMPMRDTVKRSRGEKIEKTVDRRSLWLAQTPQSFPLAMILEAHRAARESGYSGTDDSSLCERLSFPVAIVGSTAENLKITEPSDMAYAEYRLRSRQRGERGEKVVLRIGEGYDIHRLKEGRRLVLGGVAIPHEKGLDGHSDADALIHAVIDALLGAAGLGDIGSHFPDTDPAYKDKDSTELLLNVVQMIEEKGFRPVNLDATIVAQRPKLAPYIEKMRDRLAGLLGLEAACVNVKAKTHEGLGALGREEGIAARAVVLIETSGVKNSPRQL